MLVKLNAIWFAPTNKEIYARGTNFTVSGQRYRKGITEIPDHLKNYLPKDAEILDKLPEEKVVELSGLKELDLDRAASDSVMEVAEQAEKTLKERRQEQMAKARAAKNKKGK